jgi:hypothetical protein
MEIISHDWFLFNIAEQSKNAISIYNLKISSKTHNKLITFNDIKKVIINNIIHKLKQHVHINYDDFEKFIETYNFSISGSFILQCILDEDWGLLM